MRILLINDSSSNPNLGDRAAAYSLKAMITEVGGEIAASVSEMELGTAAIGRPAATDRQTAQRPDGRGQSGSLGRRLVAQCVPPIVLSAKGRISQTLAAWSSERIPQTWAGFDKAAARLSRAGGPWAALVRALDRTETVVIHGDGCMTGNGLIPRTELLIAHMAKTRFGKPVLIVNHTADFAHPSLREIAENVYPSLDDVVFRDRISLELCRPFSAGRFAPDTAFWFRPAPKEAWEAVAGRASYFDLWPDSAKFDPAKPYLCVGGSSLFGRPRRDRDPVEEYTGLAAHLRSVYPGQIVLVVSDLVDEPILRTVASRCDLPVVALTTPLQQAVDILGNSECYVGGRWHAAIFALSGGAPVVALSAKTFKMRALAEMAGLPSPVDAWALTENKHLIGQSVLECLSEGGSLRERLQAWAQTQADAAWGNVAYLETRGPE